ncbi:hypothetical protein [Paraburkholderia sediminicola]|uniref:hypothetical protein n=1 Tax=Paraburkholderia sediminicola TaxID=458836 RepID=UPI0038BC602B
MKISAEDLSAYFDAKGVKDGCPLCGTDSWSVTPAAGPDGAIEAGEVALEVTLQLVKTNSWVPMLPLVCQNCGFLRMHHTHWIQKWLEERDNAAG